MVSFKPKIKKIGDHTYQTSFIDLPSSLAYSLSKLLVDIMNNDLASVRIIKIAIRKNDVPVVDLFTNIGTNISLAELILAAEKLCFRPSNNVFTTAEYTYRLKGGEALNFANAASFALNNTLQESLCVNTSNEELNLSFFFEKNKGFILPQQSYNEGFLLKASFAPLLKAYAKINYTEDGFRLIIEQPQLDPEAIFNDTFQIAENLLQHEIKLDSTKIL